jgi:phosphate transport system protein
MATHFEIELDNLKNIIKKIGTLAEGQVTEAVKILLQEPEAAETKVIKRTEHKIDKLDIKIDEICQSIFALKQPVASDLRFIMSAMQISNEIERIGDLSLSIVKKSKNIKGKHELIEKFDIADIAKQVELITSKTNKCFAEQNGTAAGDIFVLNKNIKNNSDDAIHDIINEMKVNSRAVVSGTNLVMVLKHLERIAEHCTNIAEYVYFTVNAKIIKHDKLNDISPEE